MEQHECTLCGYRYDPARGDDTQGVAPGIPFDALPDDWVCPECGAERELFEPVPPGDAG